MASQTFAQEQKSFAEHWFGITPKQAEEKRAASSYKKMRPPVKTRHDTFIQQGSVITLDLSQPTNPETFSLNSNGVWTETYNDVNYQFIEFNESTFMLTHLVGGEGSSYGGAVWDGFTFSKNGDNSQQADWITNHFGNMAGGGIKTDDEGNVMKDNSDKVIADPDIPYLVAYWAAFMEGAYDCPIVTSLFDDVYQAKSVYINNSPWPYYENLNGGAVARALNEDGDFFKLIIHGLDANWEDNGKSVEYYLARNEGGVLNQSINWELVDISALGEVGGIYFTMASTDNGDYGMNTAAYFCLDRIEVEAAGSLTDYNFTITVPENADVQVSFPDYTGYNYRPFTKVEYVAKMTADGKASFFYNVTGKHSYRVTQAGKLTQTGAFTPSETNTELEITEEQMSLHTPNEIDHDVTHNNNYNVADIFLNINKKGYLQLAQGETFQIIPHRTWTMVDNTVNNYFLEPDYHYTVVGENGEADNSVVTIDSKGKLTAAGNGTAIVLVNYDAINAHHAAGGPFFGALWAENTGVFVVTVGAGSSGITSGMFINEDLNTSPTNKLATTAVDAELDVFYYLNNKNGFDYTFTPVGAASVSLAQPVVGTSATAYNGFNADNVTANTDGSYTVRIIEGRNIVKLTSATGSSEYQVLSAKKISYTIDVTNNDGNIEAGDEVVVKFNTLYHPCGKLAGIYNMSAGIQYNDVEANVSPYGGPAQYTFASRAQEYKVTIPANHTGNTFQLTNGVIKASGYGNPYGDHRNLTLESGENPGFNASLRTAYFGALPAITIPLGNVGVSSLANEEISVYPNPFTDYIIVNANASGTATVYSLSGKQVLSINIAAGSNRIETSMLAKGVYLLKVGKSAVKVVK
ncbi:MAG: DUF4465 domain-containing protein [Cytophagaceae bacterium]|nr:DUF4465 domain-containing protein [Cytophagaceae bacterium]